MSVRSLRGFTLIEVMVALAVVRSAAVNSVHLYDITLSHWAARDAAVRIRLATPDPTTMKARTESQTLYGRSYEVSTVYIQDDGADDANKGEFKITVTLPNAPAGTILNEARVQFDAIDG